ncbi:hypothetical protein AB0M80_03080 [Amycolatopsis sp. NPDC051045]|uniref:hypothetical protein n=1 Tax=Amycolatopsis sp. NPDC051045 TaxID=3156922 RepID=UPI00342B7688
MALAALIVSIFALLAAGASAYYGRQQAAAAKAAADSAAVSAEAAAETARLDKDRRHEERTPKVSPGELQSHNGGAWRVLHFRLQESPPLARIEAEIVDSRGFYFRPGMNGTSPQGRPLIAFYLPTFDSSPDRDQLTTGDAVYWVVDFDEERGTKLHIRLTCIAPDGDQWTIHREISVPPRARIIA